MKAIKNLDSFLRILYKAYAFCMHLTDWTNQRSRDSSLDLFFFVPMRAIINLLLGEGMVGMCDSCHPGYIFETGRKIISL
jgi:hypothetical protein